MKLKYQLFITLLVASALLIALMLAVSSWSFNRGFLGYINNNEKVRLEPLANELAAIYESEGNWDWTQHSRKRWHDLINKYDVGRKLGQLRPPDSSRNDSRHNKKRSDRERTDKNSKQKRSSSSRPPPPPKGAAWLVLADAEKSPLLGQFTESDKIGWLRIENEETTIGYVGYKRHTQLNRKIDQVFAQQQKRSFGYAALGMILFSGLLSIPLGARIVKPLLTVNNAVSEINQGNFAYRVQSRRNDELGDLARNLNNLGYTLEQNLAARQRWIAEISHELRTPLAVLQSEIEAIQDGIRAADTGSIDSLHSEVMRLNRLINDLHQLSLSDIGGLDYQMQALPLDEIVQTHLDLNTSTIEAAGLNLQSQTNPTPIFGDHQRINQLLDNLLQNSLKYTSAPGTLNVSVETVGSEAVLRWSDSSPGVSDHDHNHLFDPLFRTDTSRNRESGGSGLGLAIVQKIVEAHSGHIKSAHSQLGGLEIIIGIPLSKERSS